MTRMSQADDADLVRKLRLIEASQLSAREERRWKKRRRVYLSDIVVWTLFTLATVIGLLTLCIMLILVWPT